MRQDIKLRQNSSMSRTPQIFSTWVVVPGLLGVQGVPHRIDWTLNRVYSCSNSLPKELLPPARRQDQSKQRTPDTEMLRVLAITVGIVFRMA